jgi:hypothetical protein
MRLGKLGAGVMAGLLLAVSAPAQDKPIKVVFVCEHGAAKSVIAAAQLKKLATEKGVALDVITRGTTPDPEISDEIRKGLAKDGLALPVSKPVRATAADLDGATVVSFGPDLRTLTKGPVLDWSDAPSPSKDYGAASNDIRKRVEALLKQLSPPQKH